VAVGLVIILLRLLGTQIQVVAVAVAEVVATFNRAPRVAMAVRVLLLLDILLCLH
jgi:hypothetical protein